MKKFITIFLALFLVSTSAHATGVIREATYPEHFSDIADNEIYHESTSYLYEEGIIKGYADGTFKPENNITRAEVLKMFIHTFVALPEVDQYKNCFPDVKEEWFAPYVCYAKEKGFISGYQDGTFKPDLNISKAEFLKIFIGVNQVNTTEYYIPYTDITKEDWFAYTVSSAYSMDLLTETPGGPFYPNAPATRGGVSDNLYRLSLSFGNIRIDFNDKTVINEDDWVKGNPEAKVTFIEYGDFECQYCAKAYTTLRDSIYPEFKDQVAFVYRQFPLTSIHDYAEPAARAAESAGMMGKFWEMHDMLYENQQEWVGSAEPDQLFVTYAQELGLDPDTFESYYRSEWMKFRIKMHIGSADFIGVSGTPQFFINGSLLSGSQPVENFRQAILDAF